MGTVSPERRDLEAVTVNVKKEKNYGNSICTPTGRP